MSIIPALPCPSWCDPRICETAPSNLIHRSTPVEFSSTRADMRIAVGLRRLDETGQFGSVGDVDILLTVEDVESVCLCGNDRILETPLSVSDARFLMAALGVTVDKLEALLAVAK